MLLALLLASAAPAPAAAAEHCFDTALVASNPRYRWLPTPAPRKDETILRSPARVTFDVEERIMGKIVGDRIIADASLHTQFNPEIRYFLLFLKRTQAGRFSLIGLDYQIVLDRDGRFVMPVALPLDAEELQPQGRFPPNYQNLVKPLRYDSRSTWWLKDPMSDPGDKQPDARSGFGMQTLIDYPNYQRCDGSD